MKRCGRCLLLIVLAVLPVPTQAQTASGFGRFHALVIGCQNYKHLKPLQTPLADAEAVAQVLKEQYGFTVELLRDENRGAIMAALFGLRSAIGREDSLLIYYAGHGEEDSASETGYWQPTDAEPRNPANWISVDDINSQLKAIRAKHVLIIADSCYAGKLLTRDSDVKYPSADSRAELLRRMQAMRSLTALTSGGNEPVEDGGGGEHSVFAQAFLKALRSNRDILDGHELFDRIKRPVALVADQTPQYGDIKKAGQDVVIEPGDFLFVPKELQGAAIAATSPNEKAVRDAVRRAGSEPIQNAAAQKNKTIGQYINHGDGTVTDTKTGLMWKRCSEGLSGVECENGKTKEYTWDDAVQRFKNVEYAGYKDWRLPTIDELETLVYCSKGKEKDGICNDGSEPPTINQQAFPNIAWWYWSGSPYAGYSDYAWGFLFDFGYSNYGNRDGTYAVRLVRGGQ